MKPTMTAKVVCFLVFIAFPAMLQTSVSEASSSSEPKTTRAVLKVPKMGMVLKQVPKKEAKCCIDCYKKCNQSEPNKSSECATYCAYNAHSYCNSSGHHELDIAASTASVGPLLSTMKVSEKFKHCFKMCSTRHVWYLYIDIFFFESHNIECAVCCSRRGGICL